MLPKKILLAEDDSDDRAFFQDFLKARTDVVLHSVAGNGEEVYDTLTHSAEKDHLPDLILLDQNMPKRNGLQTLQLLKTKRAFAHIPVFIYSTYADEHLKEQSVHAGATSVFSKPHTTEGYHAMIEAMLGQVREEDR